MIRVTNQMINNSLVNTLNRQKFEMQKAETQLGTGRKIQMPSDDPSGSASQMLLLSRMSELTQYNRNIGEAKDRLNIIDGQLSNVGEILQRMRYLTIQASNGTNTKFELKEAIAKEVNQHLISLIDIGNSKDATGRPLFGGSIIEEDPFVPLFNNLQDQGLAPENSIIGVQYKGDINVTNREIERHETMGITIPGNRAFWGTNTSVASGTDSSDWVAQGNADFEIDGTRIKISAGDTIDDVIKKINFSSIEVSASKGTQSDIILTSKTPHQIWLKDLEGGTVLQELGLIDGTSPQPPNNYSEGAVVTGLSLFDVGIMLRNDLIKGDFQVIGGRDLEAIDIALENLLRYRAEVGARVNRIEHHEKRIAWDKTYTTQLLARNESIDVPETIMNLKWLESVHQYALNVGSKMIKPTLMDFLR